MSTAQRVESGKAAYIGSTLQARNEAISRGSRIGAMRHGGLGEGESLPEDRITSVEDYCSMNSACLAQIDQNREPYLLVRLEYEARFAMVSIHDAFIEQPAGDLRKIELLRGPALVPADTIVLWK